MPRTEERPDHLATLQALKENLVIQMNKAAASIEISADAGEVIRMLQSIIDEVHIQIRVANVIKNKLEYGDECYQEKKRQRAFLNGLLRSFGNNDVFSLESSAAEQFISLGFPQILGSTGTDVRSLSTFRAAENENANVVFKKVFITGDTKVTEYQLALFLDDKGRVVNFLGITVSEHPINNGGKPDKDARGFQKKSGIFGRIFKKNQV